MKNVLFYTFITGMLAVSGYSQTREIYVHGDFQQLARTHQQIAILPFKAVVKLRPNQMKNISQEQFETMQRNEGLAV